MVERRLRRLAVCNAVRRERVVRDEHLLIAGRPMRSIWASPTFVVAQTPMLQSPPPRSHALGTSRTIDETFCLRKVSRSGWAVGPPQPTNERPPRSRTLRKPRRSKKNGSSRRPAKNLLPDGSLLTTWVLPNRLSCPRSRAARSRSRRGRRPSCAYPSAPGLLKRMRIVRFATASPFESTRKL